jgi:hypothetical protein
MWNPYRPKPCVTKDVFALVIKGNYIVFGNKYWNFTTYYFYGPLAFLGLVQSKPLKYKQRFTE